MHRHTVMPLAAILLPLKLKKNFLQSRLTFHWLAKLIILVLTIWKKKGNMGGNTVDRKWVLTNHGVQMNQPTWGTRIVVLSTLTDGMMCHVHHVTCITSFVSLLRNKQTITCIPNVTKILLRKMRQFWFCKFETDTASSNEMLCQIAISLLLFHKQ